MDYKKTVRYVYTCMYMSVRPFVPEVSLQYRMTDDLLSGVNKAVNRFLELTDTLSYCIGIKSTFRPSNVPFFFPLCLFSSLNAH